MSDDFLVRDSRQPGHFWADNEVYDVFGPELGSHGFAVYMALCRNAMNGTGECRIAMSKVATQLRIGKATVHQAMHRIVDLGLAQLIAAGGPRATALYLLADVKSLTDPSYAQMRLSSVRLQNAKANSVRLQNASVRISNATGLEPNAAFNHRTPYKESKTSLQDLQNLQDCKKCHGKGEYELKGHPGEFVRCGCNAGTALLKKPRPEVHA